MKIVFKNLEKSELAREAVHERFAGFFLKFPEISANDFQVTLEMENSPHQTGPDFFNVKVLIQKGKYAGVLVKKSRSNLYQALADVCEHLLESLNRHGDKQRIRKIQQGRSEKVKIKKKTWTEDEPEPLSN